MENIENNTATPEVNSEAQAPKEVKTEPKVTVPATEALSTVIASDDLAVVTPKAEATPKPAAAPATNTATAPAAAKPAGAPEVRKPFNPRKPGDRPFGPRPDGERRPFTPRDGSAPRPFTPRADGERRPFTPRDPNAPRTFAPRDPNAPRTFTPRDGSSRPAFGQGGRPGFGTGNSKFGGKPKFGQRRDGKKPFDNKEQDMFAEVITVRRVTRVVKGGKRMRFAALVVVGDKKGLIGFANRKGMDYQDAVAKATKKAKENMVKIKMNDDFSLPFTTVTKFKSAQILLKPATKGTSLLAGGYIRPVLELVGIKNIYSKIQGSNNKVVGVEAVINALKKYS
jgi:small subunit ribosomal protein S5